VKSTIQIIEVRIERLSLPGPLASSLDESFFGPPAQLVRRR